MKKRTHVYKKALQTRQLPLGRGGGIVIRVLAFHSNNLSWNPVGFRLCLSCTQTRQKQAKTRPGLAHKKQATPLPLLFASLVKLLKKTLNPAKVLLNKNSQRRAHDHLLILVNSECVSVFCYKQELPTLPDSRTKFFLAFIIRSLIPGSTGPCPSSPTSKRSPSGRGRTRWTPSTRSPRTASKTPSLAFRCRVFEIQGPSVKLLRPVFLKDRLAQLSNIRKKTPDTRNEPRAAGFECTNASSALCRPIYCIFFTVMRFVIQCGK